MRLPGKMGCGRSKSASSTGSGSGGGAADSDTADFYHKALDGNKDSMTNSSEEQRQNRHKSHSSQGDNNHRMKGGLGIQTNGELRTNKENNKESKLKDKSSPGPLAPHANITSGQEEGQVCKQEVTCAKKNITDSQLEFFRMLDEKIEQGQDYESEKES